MRKQKQFHFIYKTTNLLSGKYYIGMHSTDNLDDGYLGSGRRLRYSINKYGKENHHREILEYCKTREELKSRETEIVNLNEIAKTDCMNLSVGGQGIPRGHVFGDDTKKKMSIKAKQRWDMMTDQDKEIKKQQLLRYGSHTELTRKKISEGNVGKTHTDETKQHLTDIVKLRWLDSVYRTKCSNSAKRRPCNRKGVVLSDETKKRISASKKGKPIKKHDIIKCPYCNKTGGQGSMKRWHFDNCKMKINEK
jgi:hypothetical protein